MILHTRGPAPVDALVDRVRGRVAALDADLPIVAARPFTEIISGALIFFDFAATMLFVFGAAGMALAAMGTYGLVSYTVRQSTHEIGIRMALGASAPAVLRSFLVGACASAPSARPSVWWPRSPLSRLAGQRALRRQPDRPVSFARAFALVLAALIVGDAGAVLAAARTNPLRALRHQ